MDQVTQQNAALVEEAAAQSLQEQAGDLSQVVSVFQLREGQPMTHKGPNGKSTPCSRTPLAASRQPLSAALRRPGQRQHAARRPCQRHGWPLQARQMRMIGKSFNPAPHQGSQPLPNAPHEATGMRDNRKSTVGGGWTTDRFVLTSWPFAESSAFLSSPAFQIAVDGPCQPLDGSSSQGHSGGDNMQSSFL